jgi:hypothetical protein
MANNMTDVTATILGLHDNITDGMAHVNTLKCVKFALYGGKHTDPDFLSFNQRVKYDTSTEAWRTVKLCFNEMGNSYRGMGGMGGITLYKFTLGDCKGKWKDIGLDRYALQMYFMHKSSMDAVCHFLSMYDDHGVKLLAIALCAVATEYNASDSSPALLQQVQTLNNMDLTRKFISLAMKMVIADMIDAELKKIALFKTNRAARAIQRVWRRVVSDPYHIVCQRRLMREFDEQIMP